MAKLVSKTYGDALFELALEENRLDEYFEEVKAVLAALLENSELSTLMNHPKIIKEEKIKVMENIFSEEVSKEMTGFILLIVEKDRYNDIIPIFEYFIDQVKAYKKIGVANVTTPIPLSDGQKAEVEKKLLSTTDYKSLEMKYQVDAGLIGGMIVRIGDRVVDSSIRTKLYDMSRDLRAVRL